MQTVPDIAKAEIQTLRAAGIQPTDDEIVWLASLGQKVTHPSAGPGQAYAHGVNAGPLTLYPLTIQANVWLDRFGGFFGERQGLYAVAYAMIHAREPHWFEALPTLKESTAAVAAFMKGCAATVEELVLAVEAIQDRDELPPDVDEDEDEAPPPDYNRVIARVVAATGIPHEDWYTRTLQEASDVLLLRRAMDDDSFDIGKHESALALKELLRAVNKIKERHGQG